MHLRGPVTVLCLLVLSACARPGTGSGGSFEPVATVREVMLAITVPGSDAVWSAGREEPTEAAEWTAIEHGALALAESGNLLLMPGRTVDEGNWAAISRALIQTARQAAEAARARDLDRLLEAGDLIYETCESCHTVYMR